MNVSEAIRQRRTVRGFKPDAVPQDLIEEILETARWTASNCNTQPWHMTIFSGEARQQLEQELLEEITAGKPPAPVFQPGDADLEGDYKLRQRACAADYYSTMGIAREDKDARQTLMMKNWQFFGAPHVGILTMPRSMGEVNAVDVGLYLQSLMLLFVEHGLASCPQGALAFYPDPIYKIGDIPEGNGILCGIAFGYEEKGARINEVRMPRESWQDTVSFVS